MSLGNPLSPKDRSGLDIDMGSNFRSVAAAIIRVGLHNYTFIWRSCENFQTAGSSSKRGVATP